MPNVLPRFPTNSQRITITGPTGTGKTVAGLYHLSLRDFSRDPWIIYDFKGDEHIAHLEDAGLAQEEDLTFVPKKKHRGIFIVRPLPHQKDEVEEQLWKLWNREHAGLWIDEGYMVRNDAFNAILTQGRSKKIPVIMHYQRPVRMSEFAVSESQFFQVFPTNDERDQERIDEFTNSKINWELDFESRYPSFSSYYFDVGKRSLHIFTPVPRPSKSIEAIASQFSPRRKYL